VGRAGHAQRDRGGVHRADALPAADARLGQLDAVLGRDREVAAQRRGTIHAHARQPDRLTQRRAPQLQPQPQHRAPQHRRCEADHQRPGVRLGARGVGRGSERVVLHRLPADAHNREFGRHPERHLAQRRVTDVQLHLRVHHQVVAPDAQRDPLRRVEAGHDVVELHRQRISAGREAVIEHLARRQRPSARGVGAQARHRRRVDLRQARGLADHQLDRAVRADRQVPAGADAAHRLDHRQRVRRGEIAQHRLAQHLHHIRLLLLPAQRDVERVARLGRARLHPPVADVRPAHLRDRQPLGHPHLQSRQPALRHVVTDDRIDPHGPGLHPRDGVRLRRKHQLGVQVADLGLPAHREVALRPLHARDPKLAAGHAPLHAHRAQQVDLQVHAVRHDLQPTHARRGHLEGRFLEALAVLGIHGLGREAQRHGVPARGVEADGIRLGFGVEAQLVAVRRRGDRVEHDRALGDVHPLPGLFGDHVEGDVECDVSAIDAHGDPRVLDLGGLVGVGTRRGRHEPQQPDEQCDAGESHGLRFP